MGWEDDRGVSEVLGAILLFGILVIAIGGYQAFVVPTQDAQVEHRHDVQVSDEFLEIQKAISNAAASERTRTTSVSLGAEYPFRVLAMERPPIASTLRTTDEGLMALEGTEGAHDLEYVCGMEPRTRSIRFQAQYREHEGTGEFVYEHGVIYRDLDDGIHVTSDQELVDGSRIHLTPLVNGDFDTTSSSSEQLRFVPGETGTVTVDAEDELNLTIPSSLSTDVWEEAVLGDEVESVEDAGEGAVKLVLPADTYTIECTPVGIGGAPDQGTVPTDDREEKFNAINPGANGSVVLVDSSELGGDASNVSIRLDNRTDASEPVEITAARLNYLSGTSPGGSPEENISYVQFSNSDDDTKFYVGGEFRTFDDTIELNDEETDVHLEFDGDLRNDDFYVLTIEYSTGQIETYFVSHPS